MEHCGHCEALEARLAQLDNTVDEGLRLLGAAVNAHTETLRIIVTKPKEHVADPRGFWARLFR